MMSLHAIPRIMISAPASSSGKTTVMCALLKLLPNAAAIKCGPDFIDPLFHRSVLGSQTGNVDLFFTPPEKARSIFAHDVAGADIAVLEGAMGYYDGAGSTEQASAYDTAHALSCPVILVVDAKGKSLSVCAEINGFASFREQNGGRSGIAGVILNRCSSALYERLSVAIEQECGIRALGYLEQHADFEIKSRHLGLATPDAVQDLQKKLNAIADAAKKSLNIEEIERIAKSAPPLECEDVLFCAEKVGADGDQPAVSIAVAQDEAFCFYYRENLDLLKACGARLVPFSPLRDKLLPAGCHALYVGGGYPELFPVQLAENTTMLQSVRAFCRSGAPVFAECGGFLYLKLAGVLNGTFENKQKLVRFGYIILTANEDTLLCKKGEQIRAHEFHYFDTTQNGNAFTAEKVSGASWHCIEACAPVAEMHAAGCTACAPQTKNIVAGFPHLYFASNPAFARSFVCAARDFAIQKKAGCAGCGGCSAEQTCGGCKKHEG